MSEEWVGVVLAGGKSRRMGRDKALLEVDGQALARRAAAQLGTLCRETVLSVGQGAKYPGWGLPQVEDLRPDCGPLAGIEAALSWAAPRGIFVLACDLPRASATVLGRLYRAPAASGAAATVARRAGRLQPLCGLYSSGCASTVTTYLDAGQRSVHGWVASLDLCLIDFDDLEEDPFTNVNSPADYASTIAELAR